MRGAATATKRPGGGSGMRSRSLLPHSLYSFLPSKLLFNKLALQFFLSWPGSDATWARTCVRLSDDSSISVFH